MFVPIALVRLYLEGSSLSAKTKAIWSDEIVVNWENSNKIDAFECLTQACFTILSGKCSLHLKFISCNYSDPGFLSVEDISWLTIVEDI